MSSEPILLFLHGVGTGDPKHEWKDALSESLARAGYPLLETAKVIAPKYAHALTGVDEKEALPSLTTSRLQGEAARQNRREFERRIGAIEFRLGRQFKGDGFPGNDVVVDFALAVPFFQQARNYLKNADVRAHILNRILKKVPTSGRLVIVGHSLGSVIAADLIARLPADVHVEGMITIGSPLASASFGGDQLRNALKEPPTNLGWWVSFWDELDPVAGRRGVSSAFPWMIDFRTPTQTLSPIAAHSAVEYLKQDVVAEAIGFALFGSKSRELAPVEQSIDVPLNTAETYALLALRYAHLITGRLEGELQARYAGAVRSVQATLIDALKAHRVRSHELVPSAVAELFVDLSDASSIATAPAPLRHLNKDDAVVPLTVLASSNIVHPFELTIDLVKRRAAMEDLAAELGVTSTFGADVFTSAKIADDALVNKSGVNRLIKIGFIGAGAVALVIATGGLALAAGAGLAGAAAITSALAAFGPGGMIGGLLTAGALVTAGGGGIAYGLASPATTAEALEEVVSRQLAAEILRKKQNLDSDPHVWRNLVQTEIEVRRELERLDEFSDPSAPTLKDLKRKLASIERALRYLTEHGLSPSVVDETNAESEANPPMIAWLRLPAALTK